MDKRTILRTYPPYCFFDRRILCPPKATYCKCPKLLKILEKKVKGII